MNNLKKMAMVTALLMLPMFIASTFAQKKVNLTYKLNQGQSFNILTEIDQDIVFDANGQTMTLDQTITTKSDAIVSEVSDGNISISTTLSNMKMAQSIFGMEIIFNSEDSVQVNPMAEKIGEALNEIIGESYKTVIDNKGNVISYDLGKFAENGDMANNISSGNSYIVFPEGKIAVGSSWEADIKPMEKSDMKVHSKYTLVKASKKTALINVESIVSANTMENAELKMEGTITGEMTVNPKNGWTTSSDLDMEMELEIEQGGMKFPATISGTISMESTKNK
jgi:hypothetical protein